MTALRHYARHTSRRVDAVEQELEGPVRLAAERDLRSEEIDLASPDRRLDRGDAALEIVLAPRPAAAQGLLAVEPCDRLHTLRLCIRLETEDRIVVEEHV